MSNQDQEIQGAREKAARMKALLVKAKQVILSNFPPGKAPDIVEEIDAILGDTD